MWSTEILVGKNILIVDDEPDILEALEEYLEVAILHKASTYEEAIKLLENQAFDLAILDIMGVRGYELLTIAVRKNIPSLMLTAHALSPESFDLSMKTGADAFLPKDMLADITFYAADSLRAAEESEKPKKWFDKLEPFFKKKFGTAWLSEVRSLYIE
ncbi:MAG: response regulator [Pseudomonadota bacterium]